MYGSSNVCDPVNGVLHGMMRVPAVGVIVVGALMGTVAHKCFSGGCDEGQVLVKRTIHNDIVAVCIPK